MDPIEYLRIGRRRWWIIALAGLFAVIAVVVTTPSRTVRVKPVAATYTATHTLFLQSQPIEPNLNKVAFYVTVGEVPKRVAAVLPFGPPAVLAAKISVKVDAELGAIRITAADPSADRAVKLADTFAKEVLTYIEETERARIKQASDDTIANINELNGRIAEIDRRAAGNPDSGLQQAKDILLRSVATLTDRATQLAAPASTRSGLATFEPASPVPVGATAAGSFSAPDSRGGRLLIVGLLGLVVGAGFAVVIDRLDTRLHTRKDTEAAFGLPVLAEVPLLPRSRRQRPEVISATDPHPAMAQPYRMLRAALLLMPLPERRLTRSGTAQSNGTSLADRHGPQVILVTSAEPGEGKTTAVANLAACFAESGRSVLILSCDLVTQGIHWMVGVPDGPGLTDVLRANGTGPRLADVARPTAIPGVGLVTSGEPGAGVSLALAFSVLVEARALADVVLIDTGALLNSSEVGELVAYVDSVLVVAMAGQTNAHSAARAGELLSRFGAPAAGVVLLGARYMPVGGFRHPAPTTPGPRPGHRPVIQVPGPDVTRPERQPAALQKPPWARP